MAISLKFVFKKINQDSISQTAASMLEHLQTAKKVAIERVK